MCTSSVSRRSKWLILALILTVVALGSVVAFWAGIFLPRKVERVFFGSCEWSENSTGNITTVDLYITNTGVDDLVINRVWINETSLEDMEWQSFPSMRFKPGDQGVLHITPSLIVFKAGQTYRFTLETAARNSFQHFSVARSTGQIQQAGAVLTEANTRFYNVTSTFNIEVTIMNSGSADTKISKVYFGTVSGSLQELTSGVNFDPMSKIVGANGGSLKITIIQTWVPGTRYYFNFVTESGQSLPFNHVAPSYS